MAKALVGVVSSDKGNKTIVVTVTTRKTHPIYKKQYSVSSKFMAHDENNDAHVGDTVQLTGTRPISARKHFKLEKILVTGRITHVEPEESPVEDKSPITSDKATAKAAKPEASEKKSAAKSPKEKA